MSGNPGGAVRLVFHEVAQRSHQAAPGYAGVERRHRRLGGLPGDPYNRLRNEKLAGNNCEAAGPQPAGSASGSSGRFRSPSAAEGRSGAGRGSSSVGGEPPTQAAQARPSHWA